jgi:deferrochelatase/peroxidase EfeB
MGQDERSSGPVGRGQKASRPGIARRRFLAAAGIGAAGFSGARTSAADADSSPNSGIEPFFGAHQAGILTPRQDHLCFAAFDLVSEDRSLIAEMLQAWTEAAWRMSRGLPATEKGDDSGEAVGLPPARLTLTFGFGPGFFVKDGADRLGLVRQRPDALDELPAFAGDRLRPEWSGGDLAIQACANDPQVCFHAIRQLATIGHGGVALRWMQPGFIRHARSGGTPRNLLGFKDGSHNLSPDNPAVLDRYLWVGREGPAWLAGGSYLVVRRIRLALEAWDRLPVTTQETIIGRHKESGAPLGKQGEFDLVDLLAKDPTGQSQIPHASHVRIAAKAAYEGDPILRRGYSFVDGTGRPVEAKAGPETPAYDAGLLFIAFQRDPRTAFIPMFTQLATGDSLSRFTTHVGSALFACPPGIAPGQIIGQSLLSGAG